MKIKRIKIDNNEPSVVAYQEAFKRGYSRLSDKQKAILKANAKNTNIKNKELRDLIKKDRMPFLQRLFASLFKQF